MTSRSAELARIAAWAGFPALLAVRIALASSGMDPSLELLWSDVFCYLLPMVLVVGVSSYLAWVTLGRVEHRFWGLVVIALGLVFIGESYWTWYAYSVDIHGPPLDHPVRLVYVLALVSFFGAIVFMTEFVEWPRAARIRFYIDALTTAVAAYPLVYMFWTLEAFEGFDDRVMLAANAAAYPVVGAAMCVSIFAVMTGWKAYSWRPWERFVAAGHFAYGASFLFFPAWYPQLLRSTTPEAGWFGLLMGFALYLLFVGGIYRVSARPGEALLEPWPIPYFGHAPIARYFPVLIASLLPLLAWLALITFDSYEGVPVLAATVLLAVLLAARSWLGSLELAHGRLSAITDPETGAFSARYLHTRLEQFAEAAIEAGNELAVVLVEIDGLRDIAETRGARDARRVMRSMADAMLASREGRIEVYRAADARLVGVVPAGRGEAFAYARRVVGATSSLTGGAGLAPGIAVAAGIAVFPEHALETDDLLTAAAIAVEQAKNSIGPAVAVYVEPAADAPAAQEGGGRLRRLRETVRALAVAVDARDAATKNHSTRVAALAGDLARALDLPREHVELIGLAGLMHDVGKIGITDAVLLKPGPLDSEERAAVEEHAALGERILLPANLDAILPAVRHHHERWDGRGYPDGLAGEEIPLDARILSVCDAYETMVAGRPYRKARTVEGALADVRANAGSQFDPDIAATFVGMIEKRSFAPFGDVLDDIDEVPA